MESCCICLDPPHPDNSLHLISCGCQGAWFHKPCQNLWLKSLSEKSPRCPICRRDAPVQVIYDFSHPMIRIMNFLYVLEIFLYYTKITPILQGTAILAFPFALPCCKDFVVFSTHYSIHSVLDMFLISEREQIFFRFLHLILLTMYINHTKKVETLRSFIIGHTMVYAQIRSYSDIDVSISTTTQPSPTATQGSPTATQGSPNATEGDKPRRSGRRKGKHT